MEPHSECWKAERLCDISFSGSFLSLVFVWKYHECILYVILERHKSTLQMCKLLQCRSVWVFTVELSGFILFCILGMYFGFLYMIHNWRNLGLNYLCNSYSLFTWNHMAHMNTCIPVKYWMVLLKTVQDSTPRLVDRAFLL